MADDVTQLLVRCRQGDEAALERLLPLVYDELRGMAARQLGKERGGHTLQATALVHEAWLRLVDQRNQDFQNRAHFLSIAAMAMRRILVNHARDRGAAKRGGDAQRVTLVELAEELEQRAGDLIALETSLTRLAEMDPRKASIVEMRFFAGLSTDEVAAALGVSDRTVERDWRLARAWLKRDMTGSAGDDTSA